MTLFLKLIIGHFLSDFPLQQDFLAKAKNHLNPIDGVPWQWAMVAHCAIHAGVVWYLTGYLFLGVIEFFAHFLIDYLKNAGKIDFSKDQHLHILCKAVYYAVCMFLLLK